MRDLRDAQLILCNLTIGSFSMIYGFHSRECTCTYYISALTHQSLSLSLAILISIPSSLFFLWIMITNPIASRETFSQKIEYVYDEHSMTSRSFLHGWLMKSRFVSMFLFQGLPYLLVFYSFSCGLHNLVTFYRTIPGICSIIYCGVTFDRESHNHKNMLRQSAWGQNDVFWLCIYVGVRC